MTKVVEPSVSETAFSCPHCHALASQQWFDVYVRTMSSDSPLPNIVQMDQINDMLEEDPWTKPEMEEAKKKFFEWANKMSNGEVFIDGNPDSRYAHTLGNVFVSKCFNCKKVSIWFHTKLVYPQHNSTHTPNHDLSEDIQKDFIEAASIMQQSPRGAAALLRLCVQKLCKQLGKPGKNIDKDIQSLVDDGLDPMVQQALDYVRVVGNQAVHPGELDLKDDVATVSTLFDCLNTVADQIITRKRVMSERFASLPKTKLQGILDRGKKKK
jgi:hypothetical protein